MICVPSALKHAVSGYGACGTSGVYPESTKDDVGFGVESSAVGEGDDAFTGARVTISYGEPVGAMVGASEGLNDGANVGARVGANEGANDGAKDGANDGANDGELYKQGNIKMKYLTNKNMKH